MAVCNIEEVSLAFVLLVDAAVNDTDICGGGGLVDLTERWIDCLLLLLAIEDEAEEEEVALQFVAMVDDEAADLDLESLDKLSLFFDLYFRVDLFDRLDVVVTISISVDGCLIRLAVANDFDWLLLAADSLIISAR